MRLFHILFGKTGIFAAFALLALAACTVVVEDEPRPRPPEPGPAFCTREYAPVCAVQGGDRRTFGNACVARAEGYRIVASGECRQTRPPQPRPPQACTFDYRPVCAVRGRDQRTFSNSCMAEADGYRVIRNGECRPDGGGGRPPERGCSREYEPVCARRGRDVRSFGNACLAGEADYQIVRRGAC